MKKGWLERQLKRASEIVASWPKYKQETLALNKQGTSEKLMEETNAAND